MTLNFAKGEKIVNPRVIIITQGLSRIVDPLCNRHNVVGIIDLSQEKTQTFFVIIRYLYQLIKFNKQSFHHMLRKIFHIFIWKMEVILF